MIYSLLFFIVLLHLNIILVYKVQIYVNHCAYLNRQVTQTDQKIIKLETWLKFMRAMQCYLMGANNWTCKDKALHFLLLLNILYKEREKINKSKNEKRKSRPGKGQSVCLFQIIRHTFLKPHKSMSIGCSRECANTESCLLFQSTNIYFCTDCRV